MHQFPNFQPGSLHVHMPTGGTPVPLSVEPDCPLPNSLCLLGFTFCILPTAHCQETSGEGAGDGRRYLEKVVVPTRRKCICQRGAAGLMHCLESELLNPPLNYHIYWFPNLFYTLCSFSAMNSFFPLSSFSLWIFFCYLCTHSITHTETPSSRLFLALL